MLGFVSDDIGPRPKYIRTLRLIDQWQGIDADQAERLWLKSRLPKEKPPAPPPVTPRVRHTPSLPRMPWDDAR